MDTFMSLENDQYNCSVCLDLMTDPVTIPCGHSYCMACIQDYWNKSNQKTNYCPQCRQTFPTRPTLNKNTMLAEILETFRNAALQPSVPAGSLAEPGSIECSFCTGIKVAAVKSCLDCRASYCKTHLHPHYTVHALKTHKLVNPTNMPTCEKHNKLLEVFCRTDQKFVCVLCITDDHKSHDIVSSETEREEKQVKLEANTRKFEEKRKAKQKEIQELETAIASRKHSAKKAVEDTQLTFTSLISFLKDRCSEVIKNIRDQEKTDLDRATDLKKQLELKLAALMEQEDTMGKLLKTEDNIYFVQNFKSMPTPSEAEELQTLKSVGSSENVRESILEFKGKLEHLCQQRVNMILQQALKTDIRIGDRVRVKPSVGTPKHKWGKVTRQSVGVVKTLNGEEINVDFPEQSGWHGFVSEMEFVSEQELLGSLTANGSFHIGDEVRVKASVVTPKHDWGGVTHKSVGRVKAIKGDVMTVDFPEFSGWKGFLSEMELIRSKASVQPSSPFKIGDSVRVKTTVTSPKYNWGAVSHKSVGVVTALSEDITKFS
ncbi:E3 ubiquitin/ISG15 ligase TRIM25-like [Trichomycterus rosablanca]|uniref:E3 ubiquitin/ISG15 ligase TRIM25-like n=1 Tax=Trichomycterus rosablanca TaxID=2290929 RepID=UPI002F35A121